MTEHKHDCCPFCGSRELRAAPIEYEFGTRGQVICRGCWCKGPEVSVDSDNWVSDAWDVWDDIGCTRGE